MEIVCSFRGETPGLWEEGASASGLLARGGGPGEPRTARHLPVGRPQ